MPWPDDYILYSISVEDIRQVADEEEFRELADDEIKRIGDKLGDYIDWHDAVRMAIQETVADSNTTTRKPRKASL